MNLPAIKLTRLLFAFAIICLPFFLNAQNITVKGKITDASSGKPIESANITTVKNSKNGTISNAEGEFSLSVTQGEKILISFIGFENQSVSANAGFLTIQLNSDSKQLSDVVVTALGIRKEKRIIGYSTQEVKGRDLIKAREPNPINSLVGKVAGLTVGASAELLGNPQVLLRGGNITLYVVDGVPINSDTWNISPDDWEAYYNWRRTGTPVFHTGPGTGNSQRVALRFEYPVSEKSINLGNVNSAIQSQFSGKDDINAKMWIIK